MAIVKLVCQGCGANLDALDNQRVMQCGYCGTTNQIKATVHEQPAFKPPPSPPPAMPNYGPPVNPSGTPVYHQQVQPNGNGGRNLILIMTMLPVLIGVGVSAFAFLQTQEVLDNALGFAGSGPEAAAAGRKFRWTSQKPFALEVTGDGVEEVIGLIQVTGEQDLQLAAVSGADGSTIWKVNLGNRANIPGQPQVWAERSQPLVLLGVGAALTAYDAKTGTERWVSNLPDAIERISVEGERLWVETIDHKIQAITLGDGKPDAGATEPGADAKPLRDDAGYDLIPAHSNLDLKSTQFEGVRVEVGYCPTEDVIVGQANHFDPVECSFAHGLAWVSRAEGTRVPSLIGYDRATKAELWRRQLTKAGTLEVVDTGMAAPRAELFGDAAIVGFLPPDKDMRIQRISLLDGKPQWEAKIAPTPGGQLTGMLVGEKRVFVNYGGVVHAYDGESGELLLKLNVPY